MIREKTIKKIIAGKIKDIKPTIERIVIIILITINLQKYGKDFIIESITLLEGFWTWIIADTVNIG